MHTLNTLFCVVMVLSVLFSPRWLFGPHSTFVARCWVIELALVLLIAVVTVKFTWWNGFLFAATLGYALIIVVGFGIVAIVYMRKRGPIHYAPAPSQVHTLHPR